MLPTIRVGARPAPRRRPGVDRLLGVSHRRRHAGYLAIASGIGLLRPMLRRLGLLAGTLAAVAFGSAYLRFVF